LRIDYTIAAAVSAREICVFYAAERERLSFKEPPHNSAARQAMSFPPSAACKFLDSPPVNLRNLHLHLTKNPFAGRPPHLCGVALNGIRKAKTKSRGMR